MVRYIDSEIILGRKIEPLIYVYVMIVVVIILSLIIFFILCYYRTYYDIRGVVIKEDNNYYIRIYVPLDDIKYIANNDIVLINDKEYRYNVISIDNEYFTDNVNTYQIIMIECYLTEKYKINNLTLDLKFLKENKKIIDYILD